MKTGMTKKQLMALAGISDEAEFYRKFPDEKSFFAKYGKKIEKAVVGNTIDPTLGIQSYHDMLAPVTEQPLTLKGNSWMKTGIDSNQNTFKGPKEVTPYMSDELAGIYEVKKKKGEGLANLVNPANKLIQGVEQLFQEKKQMKKADQWNQVSALQLDAARTSPEEIERRYVRPEDMIISPGQVFPQNFAKSGKKVKKANFGSVVGNIDKAGGFDVVSNYAGKAFDYNAGSQIGGAVGDAIKFIPGVGPVVSAIAKPILTAIGGAVDPYAKKIKKYTRQMNQNIDTMSLMDNTSGVQQQYSGFMEDGGKLKAINPVVVEDIDYELMPIAANRIYNPELSFNRRGTTFRKEADKIDGELQLLSQKKKLSNKDKAKMIELENNKRALFEYQENPKAKKFETGGKLTDYAMGGDLQMLDGNAELMSVNPYSPENGETVMLNGPSHSDGGMEINYGGNPVEAEGGEPVMKGRDGDLTIFGNMKIGKELLPLLGDEKAKGKKFKNYIADLSREEEKVASLKNKSIMKASEMDLKIPLDKLTLNSHKLNAIGSDAKLQKIADKKERTASLQQAILSTTEDLGIDPDKFSKGQIRKAKMGTTIPKAVDGYTAEGLEILTPEEHAHLRNLYRTAAGGNAKLVEAFQKEFHRIAPNRAKKILSGYDVTNYGKLKGMTNEQLESNEDGIFGKRTKQYIGLTDEIQPIIDEPQDDILARLHSMVRAPQAEEETTTDTESNPPQEKNKLAMLQLLSSTLPYFRPTDAEDLDPRQLMGELQALSTNQLEPVKAQTFTPDLAAPYEISLQDQLNEITASERASQRNLGYNPAAQSILSSEAYKAKSNVLAEQFRANQAMKDKTFSENRNLLNQAKLQNLQILDNQYVRQEQAKSNTKDTKLAALNSIASKYAQNELERKTLQTYENMYNYRFGDNMRMQNWNGLQFFNPEGSDLQPTDTPREGRVKSYIQDASGNFILHDVVSDQKKTTKSRNDSLVSAYKNL